MYEWVLIWLGIHIHWNAHHLILGSWTPTVTTFWSFVLAVVIGVLMSRNAHNPIFAFRWMRELSCSSRTASPSQWYSAFHSYQRFVILTLDGERRLQGWPVEWPDESDKGHFILDDPAWVLDNGTVVSLYQTAKMLVPAKQVQIVEFMYTAAEVPPEASVDQSSLIALQGTENENIAPIEQTSRQPQTGTVVIRPPQVTMTSRPITEGNNGPAPTKQDVQKGFNGAVPPSSCKPLASPAPPPKK